MYIREPDQGNTLSSSSPPDIVYISNSTGLSYLVIGGVQYQILEFVHTHPNTGIDSATGQAWVYPPSSADYTGIANMGITVVGIILAENGHAYSYQNHTYTNLGSRSAWIAGNCNN